uniref:Uncharacterized protein n=1 Tax=Rhizophora mucronata TaxID=61149 RepID=A0A2P2NYZ0_RHIMU
MHVREREKQRKRGHASHINHQNKVTYVTIISLKQSNCAITSKLPSYM